MKTCHSSLWQILSSVERRPPGSRFFPHETTLCVKKKKQKDVTERNESCGNLALTHETGQGRMYVVWGGGGVATSTALMRTSRPTCFPSRQSAVGASFPNLAWPSLTHYRCPSGLPADSEAPPPEEEPPRSLPTRRHGRRGLRRWKVTFRHFTSTSTKSVWWVRGLLAFGRRRRASVWHGFAQRC